MLVVPLGIARIIMGKRPNQRDKVKCVLKLIKIDVSTYVIWLPTTQEPKKHLSSYDCSCAPGFLETGTGPLDSGCEGQGLAYFVNDILYDTNINSFILSHSNLKRHLYFESSIGWAPFLIKISMNATNSMPMEILHATRWQAVKTYRAIIHVLVRMVIKVIILFSFYFTSWCTNTCFRFRKWILLYWCQWMLSA